MSVTPHQRVVRSLYKACLRAGGRASTVCAARGIDTAHILSAVLPNERTAHAQPVGASARPPAHADSEPPSAGPCAPTTAAHARAGIRGVAASSSVSHTSAPRPAYVDEGALRTETRDFIRAAFRGSRADSGSVASAFHALQRANKLLAALSAEHYAPKPASVTCRIGQVMRHRLHGWRAVIVGYDSRCQATAEWIETAHVNTLPHGVNQPFYHVLVDVRDRPLATVAYVAQDNVCAFLPGEEEDAIAHPLLPSYFSAYQPTKGAFIAAEALEQLYPDDCFTLPASVMLHDGGSSSSGNSSGNSSGCAHADTYHAAHPAVQHEAAYARTNSWRWSGV